MCSKTNALGVKTKLIVALFLTILLVSCGNSVNEKNEGIISNSGVDIKIAEDIDSWANVEISNSWVNLSVSASWVWVEINNNSGEISVSDGDKNNVKISENKTTISTENNIKVEVNSGVNIKTDEISKETQETLQDIDKLLNSIN